MKNSIGRQLQFQSENLEKLRHNCYKTATIVMQCKGMQIPVNCHILLKKFAIEISAIFSSKKHLHLKVLKINISTISN